jgi:hypothetical protein
VSTKSSVAGHLQCPYSPDSILSIFNQYSNSDTVVPDADIAESFKWVRSRVQQAEGLDRAYTTCKPLRRPRPSTIASITVSKLDSFRGNEQTWKDYLDHLEVRVVSESGTALSLDDTEADQCATVQTVDRLERVLAQLERGRKRAEDVDWLLQLLDRLASDSSRMKDSQTYKVAFLKTHKTGSSTVGGILYRYAAR